MSFGGSSSSGSAAIGSSSDVALNSPSNGQVLAYNGAIAKWQNATGVSSVNSRTGAVVLTKSDVGLSSVDNTSDLNKPISTATQTALNAKADVVGTELLLIDNAAALPPGTPAGVVVVVKS